MNSKYWLMKHPDSPFDYIVPRDEFWDYWNRGYRPIADPKRIEAQSKKPDNSINKGVSK